MAYDYILKQYHYQCGNKNEQSHGAKLTLYQKYRRGLLKNHLLKHILFTSQYSLRNLYISNFEKIGYRKIGNCIHVDSNIKINK